MKLNKVMSQNQTKPLGQKEQKKKHEIMMNLKTYYTPTHKLHNWTKIKHKVPVTVKSDSEEGKMSSRIKFHSCPMFEGENLTSLYFWMHY